MDIELLVIFAFVLTVLTVILTFGTIAGQRSRQHKLAKLEIEARIEEAKAAQQRTVQQADNLLEDRVRVLERIATDRGADLAHQIENLRDRSDRREEKVQ